MGRRECRHPIRRRRTGSILTRRRRDGASAGGQPILSVAGRAPSVVANPAGTGYLPSSRFRIAECCISTGWMVAAILIADDSVRAFWMPLR